eukprot:gene3636-4166_t
MAAEFARKEVNKQMAGFKSWGVMGDWTNIYKTMEPAYEVAQLETFYDMYNKGYIYRGVKPVHWSPSSRTALADAELEYNEQHVSKSIYVRFAVTEASEALAPHAEGLNAIIWTTTPWTIPSNLAICVNPEMDYVVVVAETTGTKYLVSAERVAHLAKSFGTELKELARFKGTQLAGAKATHPLYPRASPILLGDHVVEGSGSGLVHTAPGQGVDDFMVCQKAGIVPISPVDEDGHFTSEVGEALQGLEVLSTGNEAVIEALRSADALVHAENYIHKYPYDWRTKKPTIVRLANGL